MIMSMTVYHGGIEAVEHPRCDVGRTNLDFGLGFYLTEFRQQALEWARRVAQRKGCVPVLNVYDLDRDGILAHYRCKVFTEYDGAWLDFIVDSRLGRQPWAEFDYIEGGVADDRVVDTVNLYMADLMTRDKALERLSLHRPNNQMCLLKQEVIDQYLMYHGAEPIC